MSVSENERQDRILKAYILEIQWLTGDNFKYAMAQGRMFEEKQVEDSVEVVIVMHRIPQDFAFFSDKISKLTKKYSRKLGITIQPAFQWEDSHIH